MKPIKAWVVVDKRGRIIDAYDSLAIYRTRKKANEDVFALDGDERVIPVMIVPVEKKK